MSLRTIKLFDIDSIVKTKNYPIEEYVGIIGGGDQYVILQFVSGFIHVGLGESELRARLNLSLLYAPQTIFNLKTFVEFYGIKIKEQFLE